MNIFSSFIPMIAVATCSTFAYAAQTGVDFVSPVDGATVPQKFTAKFSVQGMTLKPAGVMDANTGHYHLIIDGGPVPEKQVVPKDATHIHYGKGQSEAEVVLPPGKHTLTLQFADGAHISYGPKWAKTITVTAK